ncbi:MAG: glycoside hydrolase family 38 C-terminal domain-containing protein [Planctomycetota bacterium]
MKTMHMVCNAHLDPVWLWEWEEGVAAAISTFRTAADLCEEFDTFVFNHNEAILYRWVEEYDPSLFKRIRKLARQGKWHIMGGWHLQPDCNMPSGESFVRQILQGRKYFLQKFGIRPTTAINFDPFGHTRGLVQILARSGFTSYLFCRPDQNECPLDGDEFIWEGYDGSRVVASRASAFYNSGLGEARKKAEGFLSKNPGKSCAILLWGVGNHGGGPSRKDVRDLNRLIESRADVRIIHSTPEAYFHELSRRKDLPIRRKDLNPFAVGCYTSMAEIKQKHRQLENELFATEKMASAAWCQGLMDYPAAELQQASLDLATAEFHDILPGSSVPPVEQTSIRLMNHGLEILSRLKARAFFILSGGQPRARGKQIPILVYNPHPFPVKSIVECEFQPADQNWRAGFVDVVATRQGKDLPSQVEQEISNIPIEWRKRVVFAAELAPSQMNRFDCRLIERPAKPKARVKEREGRIRVAAGDQDVVVNARTGLIDRFRVRGRDFVVPGAFLPIVMADDADPWGTRFRRLDKQAGAFRLLSRKDAARLSGISAPSVPAVRVIEDGQVRTVVEAMFGYGDSYICQQYKISKVLPQMEVEVRVFWNEKDRMLKLSIPTSDPGAICKGQVAYGTDTLPSNGDEAVAQKWVAVVSARNNTALSVLNERNYGFDCRNGNLRLSLLRGAAYSAYPINKREHVLQDRFTPRMDQGERLFRFLVEGSRVGERLETVDREALVYNERPMALSFFPDGAGNRPKPFVRLSDRAVQITATKKAEDGDGLIIRLYEPTGKKRSTMVSLPFAGVRKRLSLGKFCIQTWRVDRRRKSWTQLNLEERPARD